jgi:translation initiation factor RLI1
MEASWGKPETEMALLFLSWLVLNCTVEVKLLNGHDEKKLSYITKAKNKNNMVESFVTDTLKSYIVSVNGDAKRETVNAFVDTLPARAVKKDQKYIQRCYSPSIN